MIPRSMPCSTQRLEHAAGCFTATIDIGVVITGAPAVPDQMKNRIVSFYSSMMQCN